MRAPRPWFVLALFALAIVCSDALGASQWRRAMGGYYPAQLAKQRRIAVIQDSRWNALNQNNVAQARNDMNKAIGNLLEQLELEGGAEVHFYSTAFLEDSLPLWREMGSQYALALLLYFNDDGGATRTRWFCPESTTVQILHVGGNGTSWANENRGTCDTAAANNPYANAPNLAVHTNGRDTLSGAKIGFGVRRGVLPTGVTSVVRFFRPVIAGSTSWAASPETTYAQMPAAGDTIVRPHEYMPLCWRVYWTGTKHVDYVRMPPSPANNQGWPNIVWALASRYVKLNPLRYAYEWDDVMDINPSNGTRTTNAAFDSCRRDLEKNYGLKITMNVNPVHAASYLAGTNPTYEGTWSGAPYSWMRTMTWVHHAHDSSRVSSANLVGRFGGYGPGNGNLVVVNRPRYSHRYASRKGSTEDPGGGIVQRLAYSDSVRKKVCPTCPAPPPYLSFPNNEVLPMDWRVRGSLASNAPEKVGYGYTPLDSLVWAIATGLNVPDGGTLYLRGFYLNNGSTAAQKIRSYYAGYEDTSAVAATPWMQPDELEVFRVAGKTIYVRCIGSLAQTGSNTTRLGVLQNGAYFTNALMGLVNDIQRGGSPAYNANESFAADPNQLNTTPAPRNLTAMNRVRMIYQHPQGIVNGQGNYEILLFKWGVGQHLRALDALAGHPVTQCVYPWELYQR